MVLEDTGSEAYISRSGKGFMVKAQQGYHQFPLYLCASKAEIKELLDGKRASVKLMTVSSKSSGEEVST